MAKICFGKRLICDLDFYRKNLKSNFGILRQLMYININSKEHPRNHVVISNANFQILLKDHLSDKKYQDILKAALKEINEPETFESVQDGITRNIFYAIFLTTFNPYETIILTTEEKIKEYEKNPHYTKMKGVSAKADKEALHIINDFYEMCVDKEKY